MGTLHCPDCSVEWRPELNPDQEHCWICNRPGERGVLPYPWSAWSTGRYNVDNPPIF